MEVAAMVVPAVKVRQLGWWCWRLMRCAVCGGGSDEGVVGDEWWRRRGSGVTGGVRLWVVWARGGKWRRGSGRSGGVFVRGGQQQQGGGSATVHGSKE
nr:hypothetical protein [Tanacetum cinerariifolium]